MSSRMPVTMCWHCDRALDAASPIGQEDWTVEPGSVSLCMYCGAIAFFGPDLGLLPATAAQLGELEEDKDFLRLFAQFQWARQLVMIEHRLMGYKEERHRESNEPPE